MKKSLITLLVLGLISCALFVSCNSEVTASQGDSKDLVSVSFDNEGGSKSLTATLEGFNKDAYYWKYAARKADDSGLSSGATATYDEAGALPVSAGNHGLGSGTTPYQVPGFSQGLWDFMLFAYREYNTDTGAYEDLIYSGEAQNVSLTKGGSNTAHVVVNPVSTGNGIIRIGTISFVPKKAGDATSHTKVIEVTNPDGSAVSGITYDSTKQEYTVPAGAYKVTVKFTNSASTIVYAEGYVIATVYPRLKTTVAGDLNELVTYAQFDADLNPDAVNAQAVSDAVTYDASTEAEDVELSSTSTSTEKTVTTTVARADVNSIIEEMAAEQAVPTEASTTSLKLALNVDPTEATQTTVTYEIGMTATLTYKETLESAAQVSEKSVINLDNYIVVEIQMSTGLTQVNVTHSGLSMIQCASWTVLDDKDGTDDTNLAGYYYYDPAGTLYLKTKKFSPFAISYTAPTNYVASVDGVKYSTLEVAIDKADSTNKVTLLTDVALTSTVNTSKTFELDLNGFSIAAKNCRAIHVKEGTLTLSGSGTIVANKAGTSDFSDQSSVIRVGGGTGSSVGLVIGEKVTVSSNYCYGVTVFGNEATQTLEVNGKVKVTGIASAISGNGTNTLEPTTITINSGAEVSAENDYAIYHPQAGTLTINGGTISGKGGIEAKGGTVNVNGGVITATAAKTSHAINNNGTSTSGYALAAVRNGGYLGEGKFNVTAGTVIGTIAVVNDTEASHTPTITVTGGSFSKDPSAYVAVGYQATQTGDFYVVTEAQLILVEAVDSTCTDVGHHTYWKYSDNDTVKLIKDEINNTLKVATDSDIVIPARHRYVLTGISNISNGKCTASFECTNCTEGDGHTKQEEWNYLDKKGATFELYATVTNDSSFEDKTIIEVDNKSEITYKTSPSNGLPKSFGIIGQVNNKPVIHNETTERGLKLYNRFKELEEKYWYFTNVDFGTKGRKKDWGHMLLLTGQIAEIGLNNVEFKNDSTSGNEDEYSLMTSWIGLWENQELAEQYTYDTKTGAKSWYPLKDKNASTYVNLKGVTYPTGEGAKPLFQIQGYELSVMKGENAPSKGVVGHKDCYEAVHISFSNAGNDFISKQINIQAGQKYHDGVHNEWFLNGAIMKSIPETVGIYGATPYTPSN